MYWIIENEEQLQKFITKGYKEAFVEIIPYNPNSHPAVNEVCAVYIKPSNTNKGYIISLSHSEVFPLNIDIIIRVLNSFNVIYTRDKKEFLHYFLHPFLIDITPLQTTYIPELTKAHIFFYQKYPSKYDVNRVVPIVKHYEYCENIYGDLSDNIGVPYNKFINNKSQVVFNLIERVGIKIDKEKFEEHFHKTQSSTVYTQYNLKTLTTRPSNKFGGVNYAALNKKNNSRECFIPRNDKFVELDISAYHPTLLAGLVDYKFEHEDVHQAFADMYGVSYKESKHITFQQLYGGIFKKYQNLPFFKKVQKFTDELWVEFNKKGKIQVPFSNFYFEKDKLEDMNPPKLLNYLLQALETSMNVLILWDIIQLLQGKKTQIVLYTFDSILLDLEEDEQMLGEIKGIFKKHHLHIKGKSGVNYNEMN